MFGSFKRFIKAFALVLAWELPRLRRPVGEPGTQMSRPIQREKKRRQTRQVRRDRVLPPKRCKQKALRGYRGSQAKDRRFSHQRLLRRMYRNT